MGAIVKKGTVNWISYDGGSIFSTITTGANATFTKIGSIPVSIQSLVYSVSISLSGPTLTATQAVGIAVVKIDNASLANGATAGLPANDILCTCVAIPTTLGIYGDAKIVFGQLRKGFIVDSTQQISLWFYSQLVSMSIVSLVNVHMEPIFSIP